MWVLGCVFDTYLYFTCTHVFSLFFVGDVTSLRNLVSYLDFRVYGLQCTKLAPLDSIQSLAQFYVQVILQTT